jgi:DNA polymerase delta subunit 3
MASVWAHTQSLHQGKYDFDSFLLETSQLMLQQRRTAKYAPPPAVAAPKPAAKSTATPTAKPPVASQLRKEASTVSEDNTSGRSTPQPPVAAPSTLKRSDSTKSTGTKNTTAGDIFKSFAKAKAKPKEPTPAPVEDGKFDAFHGLNVA